MDNLEIIKANFKQTQLKAEQSQILTYETRIENLVECWTKTFDEKSNDGLIDPHLYYHNIFVNFLCDIEIKDFVEYGVSKLAEIMLIRQDSMLEEGWIERFMDVELNDTYRQLMTYIKLIFHGYHTEPLSIYRAIQSKFNHTNMIDRVELIAFNYNDIILKRRYKLSDFNSLPFIDSETTTEQILVYIQNMYNKFGIHDFLIDNIKNL